MHRDLKPTNVLTTRDGKRVVLKVADFGIGGLAPAESKLPATETLGQGPLTESAGTCTPMYASPQQRRGAGPAPRDDVYALGVIWYQMLVGDVMKEPPRGGSWKKRLLEQGANSDMLALLERCLEDDPAERPADAQVLTEELQAIVKEAVPPGPDGVPTTTEQWYYTRNGQQLGPATLQELKHLAASGQLGRNDIVWTEKLGQWSEAGTIKGLCPELPPTPPPVPTRVVGNVVVNRQLLGGEMWFKITFDNRVLGESRLIKGCDFPFQTTTGDHLLEVTYTASLIATKTKSYTISLREDGNYRITLQCKMGAFSGAFADEVKIQKIPGHA